MLKSLYTRLFIAVLAAFGLSDFAVTKASLDWKWSEMFVSGRTQAERAEWVKQLPVQLSADIGHGLQVPVDYAVSKLSQDTVPWYIRLPTKLVGAAVLYALLLRAIWWRLRLRLGGDVEALRRER